MSTMENGCLGNNMGRDNHRNMENSVGENMDSLIFFVNGKKVVETNPDPEMTLLTYLRTRRILTLSPPTLPVTIPGSKLGCGEGGCGACTVMVSRYHQETDTVKHYSLNACLAPICSFHGAAVTTVEGIGTVKNLHPVQERIAKFHGSQCGFCTPGIVMSMYTLLRNNPEPTALEMEQYFDGNLCRCTGYRSILDGFRTFTKEFQCAMGKNCCRNGTTSNDAKDSSQNSLTQIIATGLKPYDPTQEIIFPPELKVNHSLYTGKMVTFQGPNVQWLQPRTLAQLLALKAQIPSAKLIGGNTEMGIETKFKNQIYPVLISTSSIQELSQIKVSKEGITFGASATLSQIDVELKKLINTEKEHKTRKFAAIVEMLKWFASHQIRNVSTVSGNIVTASPISDLNPLFLAAGVTLEVAGGDGTLRSMQIDTHFFCGYRKTGIAKDEILVSITIPFTKENEYFAGFKQANRKDDDISLVNAGMYVQLSDTHNIEHITLAYGGMGATVITAQKAMNAVIGDCWDEALVPKVCDLLMDDLPLAPGSPGGVVEFRRTVALSFFFKFYVQVVQKSPLFMCPNDISAITNLDHDVSKGIQIYGAQDSREKVNQTVGEPLMHHSAYQQSTGEAAYIDDMPMNVDELHLALVTSTRANAKIISIDPSNALKAAGVKDFISAPDVMGKNTLGVAMDTVFADEEVTCQGQVIGAIVADTQAHAKKAVKMVSVEYQERTPIITIKDAIENNSFYNTVIKTEHGDLDAGFKSCDRVLEGEVYINGQNHFYMETMASRCIPLENGEMEIFCSTQNPTSVQFMTATALGVIASKVLVRTKRMGGAFGGKEIQSVLSSVPTAIAARKLGRTVRCVLERDEDMVMTGNRHSFLGKYKVGFSSDGKIKALDLEMYNNGGNSVDLSIAVIERAVLEADHCYYFPTYRVIGRVCRTNIMSNTAFRGFGAPQGHFIFESIVEHVAAFLGLEHEVVQERNLYAPEQETRIKLPNQANMLKHCWEMCLEKSDFTQRKQQIEKYNRENRWLKKGIALNPLQFGIAFTQTTLNQAGALVHVYHEGSVLIAHGGTEMGQGLHVKVMQVASEVLELPMSQIQISETSTNTVPNSSPSAASFSTDMYGFAVKAACEELKERLAPFVKQNPDWKWEDWVKAAYLARVSLSATGFYRAEGVGYNFESQTGKPFKYFTLGAACTEVQIDCLTGDHKVIRTDIVMDIGKSVNPAIDVGQIEGAFMQGYGLFMLEEVKVTPNGFHLTQGPGNYKIPSFGNIPTEFNVYLVPDSHNPFGIFASQAIGEPPLLLSMSVFSATKHAIKAARHDAGEGSVFQLNSPAVPAAIRMACGDEFAKKFPLADPKTYKSWFVDL